MAPLTGQELYKRHERKKIKDNPDDTRHRLNADELDTRLNGDYNTLDSTERRAWVVRAEELAALPDDFHHQIITAEDIYCNNEEVRKIRRKAMKRKREVKSTDEIHRRLKRRWTRLNPNQRDNFLDEEIVINEARRLIRRRIRGDPVVKKKAYEYTHEPVMEMQIAREMGTRFTELEKYQWKCHKIIGEGGNGRAMLFRKADDNNNTLKVSVLKRIITGMLTVRTACRG
ncbi:uncharacterized protein K452DRAFT_289494 [Aplosporella prunicola CBS 121167]|uniref:Uncharacterized protein n=1 Tax=Aplosporella prunicola CBS 121167 TaxID=1176127 RepID=A0A6A6B7Q9_9PEZI|nr:uncharacterized protein K452DRAFT_289494 [Aplosporella prunicola CBS 121167]KAF2140100.1 hypothetical protein K452DRAFT_289494 [Aplosporella prunicola CBS 121167]